MNYDFIIVGQGIAGTLLSYAMIKRNQSVLVIDKPLSGAPSKISAGIINPVTGRRLVKSWMFDNLESIFRVVYNSLELELKTNFLHEIEILKLFNSNQDVNDFQIKLHDDSYSNYLAENKASSFDYLNSGQYLETAIIQNAFRVDSQSLLTAYRHWLNGNARLQEAQFSFDELEISKDKIRYKNDTAQHIIFCEGFRLQQNPYFDWLPLVLAKGDLLTIESDHLPQDKMINKNFFILPIGNHHFKVGSTYEWEFDNYKPNPNSKKQLTDKLNKLLRVPYEIVDHSSGIRPTTKDRRPFLGVHEEHPNIGVFNGFGTKAYSLIPYFAKHFTDHLLDDKPIMKEVSIKRFNH